MLKTISAVLLINSSQQYQNNKKSVHYLDAMALSQEDDVINHDNDNLYEF